MTPHAPVRLPALLASRAAVVLLVAVGCVGAPAPASAEPAPAAPAPAATPDAGPDASRDADRASRSGRRDALASVLVTERTPIAFRTARRADASRYRGTEVVVQAGRTGVLERTWVDPAAAERVLLREERLREPVTKVVAVGTKPRPRAKASYGGLDWAALARCESGGNPRAVSRTGKYRGLYQFSMSTWRGVGGTGDPVDHSRDSQTAHAYKLYQRDGRSPWPHCGRHL